MKYKFFKSPIHGIGCQAIQYIKKDEIISLEPMIKLESLTLGVKSNVRNYVWASKINKNIVYLINGLGSYCNHSNESNITVKMNEDELMCEYKAKKNIEKGEELFVNYGMNWFKARKKTDNSIKKEGEKHNNSKIKFNMFSYH